VLIDGLRDAWGDAHAAERGMRQSRQERFNADAEQMHAEHADSGVTFLVMAAEGQPSTTLQHAAAKSRGCPTCVGMT
jgi:hypothetical protein